MARFAPYLAPATAIVLFASTLAHAAPPKISGTPATTAHPGELYSFRPSASDPDQDKLRFSIRNKPAWATFNRRSGRLKGTPSAAHVGSYKNIGISVSDGRSSVALPNFSIQVSADTNGSPTISGTPATSTTVGAPYSFQPSATDPNGDPLTFSITNRPAWAQFDVKSGRLSGTPTAANVGTTSNIVISVSDGKTSVSLSPFSLDVSQTASGSVTLSWTPPTTNANGSALTDLAGYRLFYGPSAKELNSTIDVPNPGIASYVLTDLAPGTHYFGIKAYAKSGAVSAMSNIASKTIR